MAKYWPVICSYSRELGWRNRPSQVLDQLSRECDMQKLVQTRDRLLDRLRRMEEAGDLDRAAVLEYGIDEFDGVIALLTTMSHAGSRH